MIAHLAQPHRCLSWAPVAPAFTVASRVAWYFLEIDELAPVRDPSAWLLRQMQAAGFGDAVGLMTSRRRHQHAVAEAAHTDAFCRCVATVGLGNSLAAGDPAHATASRTINLLCQLSDPMTDGALVEAIALAAEARTSAMLSSGVRSVVSGQPATGTGTDCIVVAAPVSPAEASAYCGKHTAIGERLGRAVYQAVAHGVAQWQQEFA